MIEDVTALSLGRGGAGVELLVGDPGSGWSELKCSVKSLRHFRSTTGSEVATHQLSPMQKDLDFIFM